MAQPTTTPRISCTTVNNGYKRLYYIYLDGKAEDLFGFDCATIEPEFADWANDDSTQGMFEVSIRGRKAIMCLWCEKGTRIHTGLVCLATDVESVIRMVKQYHEHSCV